MKKKLLLVATILIAFALSLISCGNSSSGSGESKQHSHTLSSNAQTTVITEPTCAVEGTAEGVCATCNEKYTYSIPTVECTYPEEWTEHSDGSQSKTCVVCSKKATRTQSEMLQIIRQYINENADGKYSDMSIIVLANNSYTLTIAALTSSNAISLQLVEGYSTTTLVIPCDLSTYSEYSDLYSYSFEYSNPYGGYTDYISGTVSSSLYVTDYTYCRDQSGLLSYNPDFHNSKASKALKNAAKYFDEFLVENGFDFDMSIIGIDTY